MLSTPAWLMLVSCTDISIVFQHPGEDRDGKKNKSIPVSGIGIGPVSKYDVMRCGVMLEREKEWIKMCEKEHAVCMHSKHTNDRLLQIDISN
jgi:hypothetical protein